MVKFKPGLKEVRDIEDELDQSDDDFDLSEFIPQLTRSWSATGRLPSQADGGKMAPSLDRPQTVNEFRDRPVSRRERAQKAKTDQIVNHVVGNPLHRDRERRLSVTDPTDAGKVATILQRMNIQTTECRLGGKIEDSISLEQLQDIHDSFEQGGEDGLSIDEFKLVFEKILGINNAERQIERLFKKIDTSADGFIDWDEFCSYMQLEYAEKEAVGKRGATIKFVIPAIQSHAAHREEIIRLRVLADGNLMTVSKDGQMFCWKAKDLTIDKSMRLGITEDRSKCWVTDCSIVSSMNRIFAFTGDREILIYDSVSLELYCRITNFESVPLRVHCYAVPLEGQIIIILCDGLGCISVLSIKRLADTIREWKNKTNDEIPIVTLSEALGSSTVKFFRWKAHDDWVTEVIYSENLNAIISASNDQSTAVCISPMPDFGDYFTLRNSRPASSKFKREEKPSLNFIKILKGVKTISFTPRGNLLATGGIDRVIRLWSVPSKSFSIQKPSSFLKGHAAPVSFVQIDGKLNRLVSTSQDRVIMVWDIAEQTRLLTLNPKAHGVHGDFMSVCFSNLLKTLVVATDVVNLLPVRPTVTSRNIDYLQGKIQLSHQVSVTSCIYNQTFAQVVTADEVGLVRVWDLETGLKTFEFNIKTPISCLSFDDTHRRLIIGCRDGTARIYNHNNGSLLKNLKARKQGKEVAALHMVTIGQSEYFLSVGWDRHINLYPEIDKKHVIDVRPLGLWDDDVRKGHKEDIISAALIGLNLLATASFDGEILIWNMVSGKVLNRIKREQIYMSMDPEMESSDDVENGPFFTCLAKYQEKKKILVAGHQNGSILFYNLLGPSPTLIAVTQVANYPISHLSLTEDGELLFCGDTNGNIYILDLFDFSFELSHTQVAPISATWRGHVDCVTLTASVDNREILLTSSLDATCRAWTFDGEYVGTFGQKEKWDLMEETSWGHPYTPDDVLMETTFPTLKKMEGGDAPSSAGSSKPWRNRVKYDLSNEDMFEEIRATLNSSTGKRLSLQRRLSQQPVDTKKDPASNAWRSLKIHDIGEEDVEELEKPTSMTEDPFALKSEESKHSNHVRFS